MVKKIPERKCMGCSEKFPKRELIRVVRTPEGNVEIDLVGKKNGRGVYLCANPECFKRVRKGARLSKSLETEVPESVYDEVEKLIAEKTRGTEGEA